MAVYRNIHINFWEDSKVLEKMNIEERYFLLYLLTNPHTNQIGCFEISKRQMKNETDFDFSKISELLKKFEHKLNLIVYSEETNELFIKNWHKYNWSKSPKVRVCIEKEFVEIKDNSLKNLLYKMLVETYGKDTLSIQYQYSIESLCIKKEKEKEKEKEQEQEEEQEKEKEYMLLEKQRVIDQKNVETIISHLNQLANTNFKSSSSSTQKLLKALLKEYTLEDVLLVIEKMCYLWNKEPKRGEKDMRMYLRPSTLFRKSNFENYLGMKIPEKKITTADIVKNMDFSEFRRGD